MKGIVSLAILAAAAVASPAQLVISDAANVIESEVAIHLPPFGKPPKPIDLSKYTIGQILNWTLHHPEKHEEHEKKPSWWPFPSREHKHRTLPIHKIAWLVNKTDDKLKETLFDEDAHLTFLAPDDAALSRPRHGPKHHGPPHHGPHHGPEDRDGPPEGRDIADFDEPEFGRPSPLEMPEMMEDESEDDDDDKREKRRKFFRKLLSIVLRYHLLPDAAYTGHDLADLATVRTALPFSRVEGDEHFRIRTRPSLIPRSTINFNVYAHARLEVKAKNGIIHLISAPLLPPLSPLSEAFLFPSLFSVLTTGIQKVELDEVLAPWLHGHKDDDEKIDSVVLSLLKEIVEERKEKEGKREFTVFAPTNFAFKRLGPKLNILLFSPFGRRILKKVLAYHVVPDVIAHTDHFHNATDESSIEKVFFDAALEHAEDFDIPKEELLPLHPDERALCHGDAEVETAVFDTLLPGATIAGKVVKYRSLGGKGPYVRDAYLKADGGKQTVKVFLADLPAWGGVIHVINSVLKPPFHHSDAEAAALFGGEL